MKQFSMIDFLKIKAFIVMGITLGHKYRWHATTEERR